MARYRLITANKVPFVGSDSLIWIDGRLNTYNTKLAIQKVISKKCSPFNGAQFAQKVNDNNLDEIGPIFKIYNY